VRACQISNFVLHLDDPSFCVVLDECDWWMASDQLTARLSLDTATVREATELLSGYVTISANRVSSNLLVVATLTFVWNPRIL
jgi:hypothetical protein